VILVSTLFYTELQKITAEPVSSWLYDHHADCAVVLTGGPHRIREGFDLLSRQEVKKLIISGVHPQATLREIIPQWPYYGTLDENNIFLEKRSGTTYGNAQQTLPLIEALRCRDVIIVTSRLHMYRAYKTFQATYPPEVLLYKRAVLSSSHYELEWYELLVEVLKSLFYSLWAY
jgi:uncharacterized SAM-binding protein YcdF (DUF218 family)